MFNEYPDEGLNEIESCDLDFVENDFPSISEIENDVEFYEFEEVSGHITQRLCNEYVPLPLQIRTMRVCNLIEVFQWMKVLQQPTTSKQM